MVSGPDSSGIMIGLVTGRKQIWKKTLFFSFRGRKRRGHFAPIENSKSVRNS